MRRRIAVVLIVAVLLAVSVLTAVVAPAAATAAEPDAAVARALDYLHAQLKDNGGFATNSSTGDLGVTPWAVLALCAAGYDPTSWGPGPDGLIGALAGIDLAREATVGAGRLNPPAFYAKTILALTAAGRADLVHGAGNPRVDLVEQLLSFRNESTGNFSLSTANPTVADISTTNWAILALSAVGMKPDAVAAASAWLKSVQGPDGGFAFQTGGIEDVDDTGAAMQALLAAGWARDDPSLVRACAFLRTHQNPDGGFPSWVTDVKSTAESTAWVLQALNALGEDLNAWKQNNDPVGYLLSLQQDNGCFAHRSGQVATPLMTTPQAVLALSGRSFPLASDHLDAAPDLRPRIMTLSPADGATVPEAGVEIAATFADNAGGTGIDATRCSISLDGTKLAVDQAQAAKGSLRVSTGHLSAGSHVVILSIADLAGHVVSQELRLTVPGATPSTTPAGSTTPPASSTTRPTSPTATASASSRGAQAQARTGTAAAAAADTAARDVAENTAVFGNSSDLEAGGPGVGSAADGQDQAPVSGLRMETTGETEERTEEDGAGWTTGIIGGGVAALLPLGAGLSLFVHRRRELLLKETFGLQYTPPTPILDWRPAGNRPAAPRSSHSVDRTAWIAFERRLRHWLASPPLPYD